MIRKLLICGSALALVMSVISGCSGNSGETPTGKYEILRKAVLGGEWQMYQFRLKLEPGSGFDIDLLDLASGDKVEGYFYPENEGGADVEITAGSTVIFKMEAASVTEGTTASDRFSFVASHPQGTAYVLKFSNSAEKTASIFLELIYPTTGKMRGPLDIK